MHKFGEENKKLGQFIQYFNDVTIVRYALKYTIK